MNPRRTFATTGRVLKQLSHDHRTLGLLFVVPVLLMSLLAWMYNATPAMFDRIGPMLLGMFPLTVMFLVTSIATLRERASGTMERLLTMPVGKLDIILGYAIGFGLLAAVQGVIASLVSVYLLGLDIMGPVWFLTVVAVSNAVLGTMLGLLASAFARTEFQAVQFMPAFILPQALLCGLFVPADMLPRALEIISNCLPLTYGVDAMRHISQEAVVAHRVYLDLGVVLGAALLAALLASLTLRRRTK